MKKEDFNKKRWFKLQHLRKPISPDPFVVKSRDYKYRQWPKLHKQFDNTTVFKNYNYKMLFAWSVNHHLLSSKHQRFFLIKGLCSNDNKKKPKSCTVLKSRNFLMKLNGRCRH